MRSSKMMFLSDSHRPAPVEFAHALRRFSEDQSQSDEQRVFWSALAASAARAQVFDFGRMPDAVVRSEAIRGAQFWSAGFLRLPFPSSLFWYTIDLDRDSDQPLREHHIDKYRYATLCVDVAAVGGFPQLPENKPSVLAVDFMVVPPEFRVTQSARTTMAVSCAGHICDCDEGRYRGVAYYSCVDSKHNSTMLGSLADGMISMCMILSTRGVPTRVAEPPVRLNAKRARSGKPPLVRVTHVDTGLYYRALAEADRPRGTHKSPVPHLRRGHIRRLPSGDTWVRDAVVNARSSAEVEARDHYDVSALTQVATRTYSATTAQHEVHHEQE